MNDCEVCRFPRRAFMAYLGTRRHRLPRARPARLITPHGDSELAWIKSSRRTTLGSLPLMGIRNFGFDAHEHAHAGASLPLMGIRNRPGPRVRHCDLRSSHYPSWGFGTSPSPRRAVSATRLITPHGDSERPPRIGRGAPPRSTHYPSWGFGTTTEKLSKIDERILITPHGDSERGVTVARDQ